MHFSLSIDKIIPSVYFRRGSIHESFTATICSGPDSDSFCLPCLSVPLPGGSKIIPSQTVVPLPWMLFKMKSTFVSSIIQWGWSFLAMITCLMLCCFPSWQIVRHWIEVSNPRALRGPAETPIKMWRKISGRWWILNPAVDNEPLRSNIVKYIEGLSMQMHGTEWWPSWA